VSGGKYSPAPEDVVGGSVTGTGLSCHLVHAAAFASSARASAARRSAVGFREESRERICKPTIAGTRVTMRNRLPQSEPTNDESDRAFTICHSTRSTEALHGWDFEQNKKSTVGGQITEPLMSNSISRSCAESR
jgi:hypothetical protein